MSDLINTSKQILEGKEEINEAAITRLQNIPWKGYDGIMFDTGMNGKKNFWAEIDDIHPNFSGFAKSEQAAVDLLIAKLDKKINHMQNLRSEILSMTFPGVYVNPNKKK